MSFQDERDYEEERYNADLPKHEGYPCNCESSHCQKHEPARCTETAVAEARFVGGVCLDCAVVLRNYLIPLGTPTEDLWKEAVTAAMRGEG